MADKYVQYKYPVQDIIDNVMVWVSGAVNGAYFAYSSDGVNWIFLAGAVDGVLTSYGSSQANAVTNKVSLASGKNQFMFPNGIAAQYCRMYLSGSFTVSVYELVFTRMIIAEQVVATNLAAITADLGAILAGTLQSADWGADEGFFLDLDNEVLQIGGWYAPVFDFSGGILSVDGVVISDGTVTADKLNVTSLSAISADLGIITAGEINIGADEYDNYAFSVSNQGEVTIRSATSGERLEIYSDRIKVYDSSGVLRVQLGDLS